MLDGPEGAVAVDRRALDVAVSVGPDRIDGSLLADEGIVGGHRAVGADADDLAVGLVEILRIEALVVREMLSRGDGHRPVGQENHSAAIMHRRGGNGRLHKYVLHIRDGRHVVRQGHSRRRRRAAPLQGFGIGHEDRAALRKIGGQRHVEQAALLLRQHVGNPLDRFGQCPVGRQVPQATRALRHQPAVAVRKVGDAPGVHEPSGERLGREADVALDQLRAELFGKGGREIGVAGAIGEPLRARGKGSGGEGQDGESECQGAHGNLRLGLQMREG